MKKLWSKIPSFIKNKYFITFIGTIVWMLFFDRYDIVSQIKLKHQLHLLEEDKDYYMSEIIKTRSELDELMTDNRKLEKFAREKYLMKKEEEVIFVIVSEK